MVTKFYDGVMVPGSVTPIYIKENVLGRPITSVARTGRVIFVDDFETYTPVTEKWKQASGTIAIASDYSYGIGEQSMKITTGTAATNDASAYRHFGGLPTSVIGLELWFMSNETVATITNIGFGLKIDNGTNMLDGNIQYLGAANLKWQYLDGTGFHDIPGADQVLALEATNFPMWHHLKFIVDFVNLEYVSLECDQMLVSMADIAIRSQDSALLEGVIVTSIVNETATAARDLWVDELVLTDEETNPNA